MTKLNQIDTHMELRFWEKKTLAEMNEAEWEALCDGCGLCCYRKFLDEFDHLHYTSIACNSLDLTTSKCQNYANRFVIEKDCTKLRKEDVKDFYWLPQTCAYRLLYEGKPLFDWHPLISGNPNSVKQAGIGILNSIHEKNVQDWRKHIIETVKEY